MLSNNLQFEKFKVLLVGVSNYTADDGIKPIPNIEQNIARLKELLLDKNLIGIPEGNITISFNETRTEIERRITALAKETKNHQYTLLLYYAGHGILSSEDFKLYLTASDTTLKYLESDGINIDVFKKHLGISTASRKIVILDACHSGQIHNSMNNLSSMLNADLKDFEGTYVITSASEENPSLFPIDNTDEPTYFTGKFIEVVKTGLNNLKSYCTIREIYNKIESDFKESGNLPLPQQSSFKNIDEIPFCLNKQFVPKSDEDVAWENAVLINSKETYNDFITKFPNSVFTQLALNLLDLIEHEDLWLDKDKQNKVNFYRATMANDIDSQFNTYDNTESSKRIHKINNFSKVVNLRFITIGIIFMLAFIVIAVNLFYEKEIHNFGRKALISEIPIFYRNVKMLNYKQESDYILKAQKLEAKGEDYYYESLKLYKQAFNNDINNNIASAKIIELEYKIELLYQKYVNKADKFLKADGGELYAKEFYRKALNLKPDDPMAIKKLKSLK